MRKKFRESSKNKEVDELSEDMEVVGPGQMLSEAREKLSLSIEDVSDKLKFKACLVTNIEQDIFDQKLPATFNRGYLRSYAKLVNVDVEEVLSAYDMLGIAEVQRSEMQSFSNLTEKEAEHSRLMWLSYFIAAILLGLMVLWWQQAPKQAVDEVNPSEQASPATELTKVNKAAVQNNVQVIEDNVQPISNKLSTDNLKAETVNTLPENEPEALKTIVAAAQKTETEIIAEADTVTPSLESSEPPAGEISTAVFTFTGDCWVNIYDATGERIAWGVKKSGYVMTVQGIEPLKVTLGKPELASIVFNGQTVDMSSFNAGNIAKFSLPLSL